MSFARRGAGRGLMGNLLEELEPRVLLSVTIDSLPSIYGSSITLPAGKSIIVPLTSTNTLAGAVTYSVTASSPSLSPLLNSIDPAVSTGRTFVRFSTSLGNMDFQLFNDVAPITTSYLLNHLTSPDFVNSIFFTVVKQDLGNGQAGSIIQGGDRDGNGLDNTGVTIQQELDPRVIYSGHGQLGEARPSLPDSGNSEFFVTLETQRTFDFGYSIYGQLVRGWDVLTAINNLPVDSSDRPLSPPTLLGVSVINDPTDAVLTLVSTSKTPLSGSITVTARDAFGHSDVKVFSVNTVTDTANDPPYLVPPSSVNRAIAKNAPALVTFGAATDLEGDAYTISGATVVSPAHFTGSLNTTFTGAWIMPDTGYTGPLQLEVTATQANDSSLKTSRLYTFYVDSGAAPTYSARATDVYASAGGFKTFTVTYKDDTLVNAATLIGNNSLVTVTGPNGYSRAATYRSIDSTANGSSRTVTYVIAAPGGTWDAADAGAYTISVKAGVVKDTLGHAGTTAIAGTFDHSPSAFFSERYYLTMNPGVAAAVGAGTFTSGWQHFLLYGQKQGLAASPYFTEKFYLELNPDVAAAVRRGVFKSGWQHFTQFGREGRTASAVFSEKEYLTMYPDVAHAVATGAVSSGFDHFILHGQFEGRNPSLSFDLVNYETLYPGVVAAVNAGQAGLAQTVTEHFIIAGAKEGLVANDLFNESYYLSHNPDVAAAVTAGLFRSGFEHFILFGADEGRDPSADFDSSYYLSQNPAIAAAVADGSFNSAYQHYIEYGRAEGRLPHA